MCHLHTPKCRYRTLAIFTPEWEEAAINYGLTHEGEEELLADASVARMYGDEKTEATLNQIIAHVHHLQTMPVTTPI